MIPHSITPYKDTERRYTIGQDGMHQRDKRHV